MKALNIHSVIRRKRKKYQTSVRNDRREYSKPEFLRQRLPTKWATDVTEFKWYEGLLYTSST